MTGKLHRAWVWIVQVTLLCVVAWFAWRALRRNWGQFRDLDSVMVLDPLWLTLSAACVFVSYGLLIEAWRRMILGWGQRLPLRRAIRIWCLSNMGRYLPGKVWSVAGLAVLAQRQGVSPWAATGSALAMQLLAVGSGALVVALAAPTALPVFQLVVTMLIAVTVVVFLLSRDFIPKTLREFNRDVEWRPLSASSAFVGAGATLGAWLVYGVAFWLLARGLLPTAGLSLRVAVGVFAAGYVVGLLAIFAPGGLGVREAVFAGLLAPTVGSSGALALALASRLLLSLTEIVAAGIALVVNPGPKEEMFDGT